ncbi:MAG: hypothetical protein M1834_005431 [Cirrosporium novae-zelandiae]|nr:MAG: hypothetical protein M1834_005431 [Cirrosporium novae-zelandiae]
MSVPSDPRGVSSQEKISIEEKAYHQSSKENVDIEAVPSYVEDDPIEFEEKKDLIRGLEQRHIQMIALAGTIGTGLFLGSGKAIARAGPAGAFIGYTLVGMLVSCVCISIAELSALVPLSGAVIRHAEYFFDPALSFAQGWNSIYYTIVSLPAEITAAAAIIQFWVTINNAIWVTLLGGLLLATNLFFVRVYGELEFSFAALKILLIIGLNIMAVVIVAGGGPDHHAYGFQYWRDPGPWVDYLGIQPASLGRFCGFWTTFSNAAYAYSGVEGISLAAAETKAPRRNIPKAAKRIFWRVLIFYVISIFMVGLLVPSNDDRLLNSASTAAESPFVIACENAAIPVVPHIVNAVVLTSAWSSGNSGLLGGSRILYGLAREGHAPKVFLRVNRYGIPYIAVCGISIFLALGYMTCGHSASIVFGWFQDLVSAATFVHWISICLVYLRFYYGCKKQGIDRSELPWKGPLQPYAAWTGMISFSIIMITAGYTVFINGEWDSESFVSAYFNIPLIFVLYFGYKWTKKSKVVPLEELPIRKYIEIARLNPEPPPQPKKGWRKFNFLWG